MKNCNKKRLRSISKAILVTILLYQALFISGYQNLSKAEGIFLAAHLKECARLDESLPYFYISMDEDWVNKEDIRLVLHNNSGCAIQITTHGQPFRRLNQSKDADKALNDVPQVTAQYRINTSLQPWVFTTYWPYGDAVESYLLKSGHSVKFFVARKHLGKKRAIAMPFNYEWEDFQGRAGIEHTIYSPPDLLPDSAVRK